MGTAGVLLVLALSAAIATGVVAYIIIKRKAEEEHQRREPEEAQRKAEEERQRREAEEAQGKAEAERQGREAEEAQQKAGEDRQRREAEEAKRKVEEERQRREAEEAQGKAEAERQRREAEETLRKAEEERESQEERKRSRVSLDRRPPRRTTDGDEKQPSQQIKPRQPKPEIVCWQRERRWILAAEVPEDLWEEPELVVHQNASPLAPDEREGHWRLDQVCGQVTVHWNQDEAPQVAKITLGEENYLLFKLSGQDQKQGRRVKSPSSGSYLVVVPESWERDEQFSGSPLTSPEPISVEGYQGHFFDLERGSNKTIAFRSLEGELIQIKSKATQFKPVGSRLEDASEGVGPLFGKSPPRIQALSDNVWVDIGTVVIGEEGSGRGRWRKSFSPAPEGKEQNLPAEAAPRKDGWYFLRFYDMDDDLVESLDFRLVCALREIKIFQPSPFPSEGEHGPVYVEFIHESDCVIEPADDLARSVQVESKNNKTILTVPPEPIYDETRWRVGSEGKPQIQIAILVERLWWAVGEESNTTSEWDDQVLTIARDEFTATSKKALWLRLPRRRWVDRVLVGFEQPRARPVEVKVTEKTVAIPLRDFGDTKQVGDRQQKHALKVWIKLDDGLVEGLVAKISAQFTASSDLSSPAKQTIARMNALCKGGNVIYGNCRHCRKKAEEIRATWI